MNDTTAKFIEMMLRARGLDSMDKRMAVSKADSLQEELIELKEEHAEEVATLKSEIEDLKRRIEEDVNVDPLFRDPTCACGCGVYDAESDKVVCIRCPKEDIQHNGICECGSPASYNASLNKVICSECEIEGNGGLYEEGPPAMSVERLFDIMFD